MISCYQHNETDNFNKLSGEDLRDEGSKCCVCVLYRRFNSMVTLSGGLKFSTLNGIHLLEVDTSSVVHKWNADDRSDNARMPYQT